MDKQEFIATILPGAIQAYKELGVLPSLTIAQAILESGWGSSAPGNMLFGLKWTEGCGYDWQLLWTSEYYDGVKTKIQAKFRKYESMSDSIIDHSRLLSKARYAKVLEAKDYREACQAIYDAGYATDPNYPQLLITLIEQNNLDQYDIVSDPVTDAINKLTSMGFMASPEYWLENARPGKTIDGQHVGWLLQKIANTL